jgi:hypothetical protein
MDSELTFGPIVDVVANPNEMFPVQCIKVFQVHSQVLSWLTRQTDEPWALSHELRHDLSGISASDFERSWCNQACNFLWLGPWTSVIAHCAGWGCVREFL